MRGWMKRIRVYVVAIVVMAVVSVISLLIVSVCSYNFKWYADRALIGITITYILAGLFGGFTLKRQEGKGWLWNGQKIGDESVGNKEKSMAKKMLEAILLGSIFMLLLMAVSTLVVQNPFEISSRMLMIWMLLAGSACLGRIL